MDKPKLDRRSRSILYFIGIVALSVIGLIVEYYQDGLAREVAQDPNLTHSLQGWLLIANGFVVFLFYVNIVFLRGYFGIEPINSAFFVMVWIIIMIFFAPVIEVAFVVQVVVAFVLLLMSFDTVSRIVTFPNRFVGQFIANNERVFFPFFFLFVLALLIFMFCLAFFGSLFMIFLLIIIPLSLLDMGSGLEQQLYFTISCVIAISPFIFAKLMIASITMDHKTGDNSRIYVFLTSNRKKIYVASYVLGGVLFVISMMILL
ncbi:MAG: hypothetical protein RLP44_21030 [Aggregatilineales bacterium]